VETSGAQAESLKKKRFPTLIPACGMSVWRGIALQFQAATLLILNIELMKLKRILGVLGKFFSSATIRFHVANRSGSNDKRTDDS
jgi:hypothetical protein